MFADNRAAGAVAVQRYTQHTLFLLNTILKRNFIAPREVHVRNFDSSSHNLHRTCMSCCVLCCCCCSSQTPSPLISLCSTRNAIQHSRDEICYNKQQLSEFRVRPNNGKCFSKGRTGPHSIHTMMMMMIKSLDSIHIARG